MIIIFIITLSSTKEFKPSPLALYVLVYIVQSSVTSFIIQEGLVLPLHFTFLQWLMRQMILLDITLIAVLILWIITFLTKIYDLFLIIGVLVIED